MQSGLLKAIRHFGSQTGLAKAVGVKQQAVSNWLNRQCHIPYIHVIKIVCLTKGKVSPKELAPDDPLSAGIEELFKILQQNKEDNSDVSQNNIVIDSCANETEEVIVAHDQSDLNINFDNQYKRKNNFRKLIKKLGIGHCVKISPHYWEDVANKKMKPLKSALFIVSLYAQTCRHANIIGVYHLPLSYISYDTGLDEKKVHTVLRYLLKIHFCSYDKDKEYIWVHEMAINQVGEKLDAGDRLNFLINDFYHSLPELSFLDEFYQLYRHRFLLTLRTIES